MIGPNEDGEAEFYTRGDFPAKCAEGIVAVRPQKLEPLQVQKQIFEAFGGKRGQWVVPSRSRAWQDEQTRTVRAPPGRSAAGAERRQARPQRPEAAVTSGRLVSTASRAASARSMTWQRSSVLPVVMRATSSKSSTRHGLSICGASSA